MDDETMELLYRAAKVNVAIRNRYEVVKTQNPGARYFTYVLLLQSGRFYVGSTDNCFTRLLDHFSGTGNSAAWVREWGPPVRVLELMKNSRPDDEEYKYMEYATMFGWEAVRGGGHCKVIMSRPPPSLDTFARDDRRFEHMSRQEIDDIMEKIGALIRDSSKF
jgi:predicted GIY-YIG superfamily endonuclease